MENEFLYGYLHYLRYPIHTLVLPHLNKAENFTIGYGKALMMNMGCLVQIILTGILFLLLIMLQETGQHKS